LATESELLKNPEGRFLGPFPGQQTKFFEASQRIILYGGAGGGGKSLCGMGKFGQQLAVEHERFNRGEIVHSKAWGLYLRRTMPDMKQAIEHSQVFFKDIDPDAEYNVNDHLWTIPSCGGAKFQFGHMQTELDKYKYKSSSFSYIFMDELTEFTETMWEYMDTRLRVGDKVLDGMLQICAASNPDGPGLLWVRRKFIEKKEPEVTYRVPTKLRDGRIINYDSVFIPAKLEDNPVLMASGTYEASLINKRPEVREAILNGNWYVNPGAFLANIWDSRYHVCKNHDVPRNAPVFRTCDPAPTSPSSVTWWYVNKDGGFTGIFNLYLRNHDASMLAGRIREVEIEYGWWDEEGNKSNLIGPIDEDAFSKSSAGGPSYARIHAAAGIRWVRSKKDRFNGTCEVIRRLNMRTKSPHEGGDDIPGLRWMERCIAPIETIPILQTDPNDVNDVDTKGEDHCWDETRYGCMYRTLRAMEKRDDEDEDDNVTSLDEYRRRVTSGSGRRLGEIPGGW
jgi:hypothetical protein